MIPTDTRRAQPQQPVSWPTNVWNRFSLLRGRCQANGWDVFSHTCTRWDVHVLNFIQWQRSLPFILFTHWPRKLTKFFQGAPIEAANMVISNKLLNLVCLDSNPYIEQTGRASERPGIIIIIAIMHGLNRKHIRIADRRTYGHLITRTGLTLVNLLLGQLALVSETRN
jgi:hypothetical protein